MLVVGSWRIPRLLERSREFRVLSADRTEPAVVSLLLAAAEECTAR
jgi:hypothetical protein